MLLHEHATHTKYCCDKKRILNLRRNFYFYIFKI